MIIDPPILPPDGSVIHVWVAGLDAPAPDGMLDAEERARVARFYFERDRRRFAAGRAWLRVLLGRYLGVAGEGLRFDYGARGKPFVMDEGGGAGVRFNVSHSGGRALLVFARGREIGVDLEAGERLDDAAWPGIMRRVFSEREGAEVLRLPEGQRRGAFLDGWTRKEALLKAAGLGITDGLREIEVSLDPARPPEVLAAGALGADRQWMLRDLRAAVGCAAALAIEGVARLEVETRTCNPDARVPLYGAFQVG